MAGQADSARTASEADGRTFGKEQPTIGPLSFIKEAGEKLFGKGATQSAMTAAQADPASEEKKKAANDAGADAILAYIESQGLEATALTVTYDGATATV